MPEGSDLDVLVGAVATAFTDAVALTAPLSEAQANWQPGSGSAGAWSSVSTISR